MGWVTKEMCPLFPESAKDFSILQTFQISSAAQPDTLLSGNWARFPRGYGVRGVKLTTQLPQIPRSCKLYFHCPSRPRGLHMGYVISDPVYVCMYSYVSVNVCADKSLAWPTSRCILFDGENVSFDASLVLYIYIYSTNIPSIMIINRIYEHQNLLSL